MTIADDAGAARFTLDRDFALNGVVEAIGVEPWIGKHLLCSLVSFLRL